MTTDDGAVGTKRCPLLDQCLGILAMNGEVGTGRGDISKYTGWAAEDIVLNLHTLIDGHVVLDTYAIADADIVADVHILAQGAVATQTGTTLHMAEVPNLRASTDLYIIVDIAGRMDVIVFHIIGGRQQVREA